MTFSFHPEAEEEFNAVIGYYEGHEAGLGYDFSAEVFTTIQNIINYPEAWPVYGAGYWRKGRKLYEDQNKIH